MPNVERYGFRDMHARMDEHVTRESKQPKPRRTNGKPGDNPAAPNSQRVPITNGVQVDRGEVVTYPYGGKPYETITRGLTASKPWKQEIARKHDLIGQRVAREISAARPGCTLITVQPHEATAFAYKIRAALKGKQISDRNTRTTSKNLRVHKSELTPAPRPVVRKGNVRDARDSKLHIERTKRVLAVLEYAANTGKAVTLGVYTRGELKIIGSQRTNAKHMNRHVRNLEAKLAGRR